MALIPTFLHELADSALRLTTLSHGRASAPSERSAAKARGTQPWASGNTAGAGKDSRSRIAPLRLSVRKADKMHRRATAKR